MPPDDLLPHELPPDLTPSPAAAARRPRLICEFCDCPLVQTSGDMIAMSDKAKAFRKQAEVIEQLRDELRRAKDDIVDGLRERDEARAALRAATAPTARDAREPFRS